ncbi:ribokinase [Paracoccus sp. 11-3]|uniref:Ribokinase n=1 Tax=Paracoccus amoyensis TaxID=2760093 RepID=A0A926GA60_9RHOB|nr:ribokinase [Paracoccus amoyensis]MBC9246171.1 ribokinase [Paracoccus amoyensis]
MAIWNLGSINIDHIYRLDHLPKAGETISALDFTHGLGGKGANQSVAAARAGAETYHLGAMGSNDQWVIERLADAGIFTGNILRMDDVVTGHAIILLDENGENSIIVHPGANRKLSIKMLQSRFDNITARDTLLIQNETNCQVEGAKSARKVGARVVYSAAPFEIEAVRAILPYTDILAMNAGEADQLFTAIPGDLPVSGLLITRGADGAEYRDLTTGQTYQQAAFRVKAVDTTGAGDTFAGYFAAALDRGDTIPEALRLASAASALQVTRYGAGDAIPMLEEVVAFLAKQS